MRFSTSRRSSSSCFSPGPRMPMPALMRDRWVHIRFSRGSEYSSWASSTARRASCVLARGGEDVEDHLAAVEHLDADGLFQVARLGRRQVVVEDDTSASCRLDQLSSAPRPCPCRCSVVNRALAPLRQLTDDAPPAVVANPRAPREDIRWPDDPGAPRHEHSSLASDTFRAIEFNHDRATPLNS